MSATNPIETQETNLQERAIEAPSDASLPASEVIEAQSNEMNAEGNSAPRFIP